MTPQQIFELIAASLTIIITILLVVGLKVYGNLPVSNIGPELNLLTYGFLWDTVLKAINGSYWLNFPKNIENIKPLILIGVILLNIVLMAINFKLAYKLEEGLLESHKPTNRFLVYFIGIVSLTIFLVLKVFVD